MSRGPCAWRPAGLAQAQALVTVIQQRLATARLELPGARALMQLPWAAMPDELQQDGNTLGVAAAPPLPAPPAPF